MPSRHGVGFSRACAVRAEWDGGRVATREFSVSSDPLVSNDDHDDIAREQDTMLAACAASRADRRTVSAASDASRMD